MTTEEAPAAEAPEPAPEGKPDPIGAYITGITPKAMGDGTLRAIVGLSIPLNLDTSALVSALMLSMKQKVYVAFGFEEQQGRLDLGGGIDAPPLVPDLAAYAEQQGVDLEQVTNSRGDLYFAHAFMPDKGSTRATCQLCEDFGAEHPIHSAEALETRERLREEMTTASDLANRLIETIDERPPAAWETQATPSADGPAEDPQPDVIDESIESDRRIEEAPATTRPGNSRRRPSNDDEAKAQTEAEAALAAKAK